MGLDERVLRCIHCRFVVTGQSVESSQDRVVLGDEELFELGLEFRGGLLIGSWDDELTRANIEGVVNRLHSLRE